MPPPVADYPFLQGYNIIVLVDRFYGWLSIYGCGRGEFDGKTLQNILRDHFTKFNIPEEFATDSGPQMMSLVVQECLKR